MRFLFPLFALLFLGFSALAAVAPQEILKDAALEARAREISRQLRCLVCQGETVDESEADFAKDIRMAVRERLKAGDTDRAVIAFLHDRYGDFILLKPPFSGKTALLWFTPFLVLGAGLLIVKGFIRRQRS
jgi:cytochrome c-type biogenesis protein CcmH